MAEPPGRRAVIAIARSMTWQGAVSWVALAVGCTSFEPGTDELSAGQGPLKPAAEPGRDWACVSDEELLPRPLTPTISPRPIVQSIQIVSFVTGQVVPGLSVRACSQRDLECASPVTESYPVQNDGWIHMPLYESFAGYLEITGPSTVPILLFYPVPVEAGQEAYASPITVIERAVLPTLAAATSMQQNDDDGFLVLRALDCVGGGALDVSFGIDKEGIQFYLVAGLPSATAVATSDAGVGGFLNVSPGIVTVRTWLAATGRDVAPATTIMIRPGWESIARFDARVLATQL